MQTDDLADDRSKVSHLLGRPRRVFVLLTAVRITGIPGRYFPVAVARRMSDQSVAAIFAVRGTNRNDNHKPLLHHCQADRAVTPWAKCVTDTRKYETSEYWR